jgi:GNAT superfamily N-acetyltransferase
MRIEVSEHPAAALEEYAAVPISFEVNRVLDVSERAGAPGQFLLSERRLDIPYIKDYDSIEGGRPAEWAKQFDVSNWGIFAAYDGDRRVGGAAVAFDTPALSMLEGRRDLAVLWDIRVSTEARGRGVGSLLFRAVEEWARERGCRQLKVETQNINVAACRFYERQGCALLAANRHAYPALPDEIQLLWSKAL